MKLRLAALSCAISLALAAPATLAQGYSNIYFFGDSLTDTGAFAGQPFKLPPALGGQTITLPANARWTLDYGPNVASVLAGKLGLGVTATNATDGLNPNGNNFAQGGAQAQTATPPSTGPSTPGITIRDVPQQVQDYLARTGGRADPNAAYFIWAGGNDVPAAATIGAIQGSQAATNYILTSAGSLTTQVGSLQALGARTIIVPNLPDFSITPASFYAGLSQLFGGNTSNPNFVNGAYAAWKVLSTVKTSNAADEQAALNQAIAAAAAASGQSVAAVTAAVTATKAGLQQLSQGFNAAANLGLSGLGVGIVRPDIAALLNEIIASPTAYGFTNVTGSACPVGVSAIICSSAVASQTNPAFVAGMAYLFTDDRHPTPQADAILGQYIYSLLAAPAFAAALPETGLNASRQLGDALTSRYQALRATPRKAGTVSGFASGGWRPDSLDDDTLSGKTRGKLLTLGIDFQATDTLTLGMAFAAGKGDNSVDNQGDFDSRQQLMALLASWQMDHYWADGDLHLGNGHIDTHRQVTLGPMVRTMNGTTRTNQYGWRVNGGYQFDIGPVQTGPVVGLDYVKVKVGGITEDGNLSTSMNFDKQNLSSFLSKVGWQVQGTFGQFTPYANASWVHEFKDDARSVAVGLNTQPGLFTTTVGKPDSNWAEWKLGASAKLTKTVSAYGELATTSGRSTGNLHAVTLGLAASF
ncbi:autotransporter domain-containing protein [Crenobacter sp. SG2303]|uniref:Autotransporter domain-containing protein n=1 Tax=Crenobacter oryzisoli TaxID=3056844 RepID=A0ABT7XHS4_9NEIS|nr:autotransporter domain-containing protein [Crenobacter sp. SG2303]MDN0073320.1 autotransporter domain-containing protein [Crenobacter sp. SG2303]